VIKNEHFILFEGNSLIKNFSNAWMEMGGKSKYGPIQNKLTLNIKKSCHIVFSKKHVKLKLELDRNQLNLKNITNYLGLHIDKHLNWESHIEKMKSSLAR